MLTKYSFAAYGPWGSLRPWAYRRTADRTEPFCASYMPTTWTMLLPVAAGCVVAAGAGPAYTGAACRAIWRGFRLAVPVRAAAVLAVAAGRGRNSCSDAPSLGGLYGSYAVTVARTRPSHPSISQTIAACCSDWIFSDR